MQQKIVSEGWGKQYLFSRNIEGGWGQSFYQPKWISTHYTLLDLRNLNLNPENEVVRVEVDAILSDLKSADGGIKLGPSTASLSDVCVNAMVLNYASNFRAQPKQLYSLVDCILKEKMPDGGFNCLTTRSGAVHSSLHTTISVLEGLFEFKSTRKYRIYEIDQAIQSSIEFILQHQLFLSDKTGHLIHKDFLKLAYPSRWKYDILRAMDFLQYAQIEWDVRMQPAVNVLLKKRNKGGNWYLQAKHPGKLHFEMEQAGKPSRWNTLRCLRVLKHFDLHKF